MRHAALLLLAASIGACSSRAPAPPPDCPDRSIEPSAGAEAAPTAPLLEGAYRVEELGGRSVAETLVQDPDCYAGRALFTFEAGTLTFSLETACRGHDRHETVCRAELTSGIEWEADGFRVPAESRARGTVSQFFQAPTAAEARALAEGESVSGEDFEDSCHVGLTPMRWTIARRGDQLELRNDHGDVMRLTREDQVEVDWRTVTRGEYERRAAGRVD